MQTTGKEDADHVDKLVSQRSKNTDAQWLTQVKRAQVRERERESHATAEEKGNE